jgi:hypothetical protein
LARSNTVQTELVTQILQFFMEKLTLGQTKRTNETLSQLVEIT